MLMMGELSHWKLIYIFKTLEFFLDIFHFQCNPIVDGNFSSFHAFNRLWKPYNLIYSFESVWKSKDVNVDWVKLPYVGEKIV